MGYPWKQPSAKDGESKEEAFVRHMIRRTVDRKLQDLIAFLHHPMRVVGVVVEIACSRGGGMVS